MEATWAISCLRVDLLGLLLDGLDRGVDRLLDALASAPCGLAPAATLRRPSRMRAWASTVAVVVPSPATSLVLVATSFTSWAPMFSKGSSSSTSRAMVTPSLVIVGAPNFFSMTTLRPFGPSVTLTVSASLFDARLEAAAGGFVELQDLRHRPPYLVDLGQHVTAGEDEQVLAVEGDLGAAVLRVDDGVAHLDVERDELAGGLGTTAGADGEDLALLGLLLGGVGDDQAGGGGLFGLAGADDDPVVEGVQTSCRFEPPVAGVSTRTLRVLTIAGAGGAWQPGGPSARLGPRRPRPGSAGPASRRLGSAPSVERARVAPVPSRHQPAAATMAALSVQSGPARAGRRRARPRRTPPRCGGGAGPLAATPPARQIARAPRRRRRPGGPWRRARRPPPAGTRRPRRRSRRRGGARTSWTTAVLSPLKEKSSPSPGHGPGEGEGRRVALPRRPARWPARPG